MNRKTLQSFILWLAFSMAASMGYAQRGRGTLKGRVIDATTQQGLIGATVLLEGIQPPLGATADTDGNFSINNANIRFINL